MYDLSKNFYKRNELSIKKDESVLTGEGPGSLSSCIRSKGYRFMKDVCCPECALSYLHEYIGDVEKYVIYTEKDANFANKNLVNPLPLIWKGDAGEIIDTFNKHGFDCYWSGNEKECIFIFPQYWDYPTMNFKE
ncbi:hypothetical protein [Clostridium sp.]|uniref:hypothetical protein n=1 Tax=Clostridium sp. TaxID=1506 RepID=UPI001B4DDD82|nr:hypothetical protein [Clostridium sp.]MBP3917423.1 hypothetical protein [Clostridium sp.]